MKKEFDIPKGLKLSEFKKKAFSLALKYDKAAYFDNNEYQSNLYSNYELLIGISSSDSISGNYGTALNEFEIFL